MGRPQFFSVQAERLCRVRRHADGDDVPFELDADGFLERTFSQLESGQQLIPGALLAPEDAAAGGALVLLGEPGVGKSSAFRRLTAGLPRLDEVDQTDPVHAVLWVDGADLVDASFDAFVGDDMTALRGLGDASGRRLTLVLDQIDESPMLDRLPGRLGRALRGVDPGALRVLVACRTADFRNPMREVLERHFEKCVLADLAPLSRAEAIFLAGTRVDGEALIAASVAAGAGSLASVPLTLELLVRTYENDGQLNGDAVTLFKQGAWQLAEEPDPDRHTDVCSVQERLAIAGRLAARLLLSGRRSIWLGSGLEAGQSDLAAGTLASGTESTPNGSFDVHEEMVRETIGTALFTTHGQDRLGFRHSSLAAYLAADYVRRRDLPRHQLTSLFLVDAADQDTASIPVPLRETAAWLVALDPTNTEWLAAADPQSLMAHSAIVSSDAIRALVVERLLDRAGEVELSDTGWRPGRWRVAHPQLVDQLKPVLGSAAAGAPPAWTQRAKIRLAVRLARDAAVTELAELLLAIAEHNEWDIDVRQLAARTALEANPDVAIPRLRALLQLLLDPDAHEIDQHNELEGLLLQLLWPDHLTLDELLVHVRPPRRKALIGTYVLFLHGAASHVEEGDLSRLLAWTRIRIRTSVLTSNFAPVSSADPEVQDLVVDLEGNDLQGSVPTYVVDAIVERALESVNAIDYLETLAHILWPRLRNYDRPSMPAPIDLINEDGTELGQAQVLRRALARTLVAVAVADKASPHGPDLSSILDSWSTTPHLWAGRHKSPGGLRQAHRTKLLDTGDFMWALDEADAAQAGGDEDVAKAMGWLAANLFDGYDLHAFELAYARQDGPAWEYLKWIYDGVELDGPYAQAMRRAVKRAQPKVWDKSAEFIDLQRQRLASAVAGDTHAFWQLLWNLQFDPITGEHKIVYSDDVRTFDGFAVLGDDAEDDLATAALEYLTAENDHRNTWLGEAKINYLAWAGCMALVLLQRTNRLDGLSADRWKAWAGALLSSYTGAHGGEGLTRRKALLKLASGHVPAVVATALHGLVKGALARGGHPAELTLFSARYAPEVANMMAKLQLQIRVALSEDADQVSEIVVSATVEARAVAVNTWAELIGQLIVDSDERGATSAIEALAAPSQGTWAQHLAVAAGRVLLYQDARLRWPVVAAAISRDGHLSRELALACSSKDVRERVMSQLAEAQLADAHRWLSALFDRSQDAELYSPQETTPDESARSWRNEVVRVLGPVRSIMEMVDPVPRAARSPRYGTW